jgi:CHAT domain-containing protein
VLTIDRDEIVCDRRLFTELQRAELESLVSDFAGLRSEATWPDRAIPALGALLLPDAGARLLEGKTHLIVSPNGLLHQVPIHALTWQGRSLVESFAVSYVPNFAALTRRQPRVTGGPGFVVGIGTFSGARALRTAEQEAAAVAALYPQADLLLGPQADRAALDARVADGRLLDGPVIHLATHGQDGPLDDPLAARLLLADGEVDGPTLAGWQLAADLVVLSACWSAQRAVRGRDGSELFGDEVYGLQSAFFAAGARQVLGAMWPARDPVTAALMTRFHGLLTEGTAADVALQTAMIEARAADGLLYHWAPYKLTMLGRPPLHMESS